MHDPVFETMINQIRQGATKKGCTASALVRQAVEQAFNDSEEAERRIAATIGQIRSDFGPHAPRATKVVCVRRHPRQGIADWFA